MIKLNSVDFFNSLKGSTVLKRSPSGGRSKISKITEIQPFSINKIKVITPFNKNILDIEGTLDTNIFIDAFSLEKASFALLKSKKIILSVENETLALSSICKITIPLK